MLSFDNPLLLLEVLALLLTIGACGGFLSGLLGVGGGIIFVPALYFSFSALGLDTAHAMHLALGSSLAIVFATGMTSARGHYLRGAVDLSILKSWGLYIVAGVVLGTFLVSVVHGESLKRVFAMITFLIAIYMALSKEQKDDAPVRLLPLRVQHGFCVFAGALAALIGVSGAILTVPLMTWSGVSIRTAVGTGAALGMLISLPGSIGYMLTGFSHMDELPALSLGYVNLMAVAMIVPASVLLAPVGVATSHNMSKPMLRRVFSFVLLAVSLKMMISF